MTDKEKRLPGAQWRVLARDGNKRIELRNEGVFDELVVDDWMHMEQLAERSWWIRLADARLQVEVQEDGSVQLQVVRDFYD